MLIQSKAQSQKPTHHHQRVHTHTPRTMCKVYYHHKLNSSVNSDKMFGKRNKTENNTFRLHCIYFDMIRWK